MSTCGNAVNVFKRQVVCYINVVVQRD